MISFFKSILKKFNTSPKLKSDLFVKLEKLNINIFNDKRIKIWKIGKK
jgi:hypothetical protein